MILQYILTSRLMVSVVLISLVINAIQLGFVLDSVNSLYDDVQAKPGPLILVKPYTEMYADYLEKFNKSYYAEEWLMRLEIFKKSLKEISRLNKETGAVHGLTKFSDMFPEEIFGFPTVRDHTECQHVRQDCPKRRPVVQLVNADEEFFERVLPDRVDWRETGKVGPVLNQRMCLGCWAFSIVGVMESMAVIDGVEPTLVTRSVQEVLDCGSVYGEGCRLGNVVNALRSFCSNQRGRGPRALVREEEYPMTLIDETCWIHGNPSGRRVDFYERTCATTPEYIQKLVAFHGPVIAVVNASPWTSYLGGVIQRACHRSFDTKDHVVQIVGYDRTADVPYYLIRNSWGEDFGINGYVKIAMKDNICGIHDEITHLKVY